MSKDGDWIIREARDACDDVLAELEGRGARYWPAAPLDVRWLTGGLALATTFGRLSSRPAVRAARQAPIERRAVVVALAEKIDPLQQTDRRRVAAYETAAQPFLQACRAADVTTLTLRVAHARIVELAEPAAARCRLGERPCRCSVTTTSILAR